MLKQFDKKRKEYGYDRENEIPVLRCGTCPEEQIAGFKNKLTGKFREVMLIRDGKELDSFMDEYDLSAVIKES